MVGINSHTKFNVKNNRIPSPINSNSPWNVNLSFNGANGSASFVDSSSSPKTFTAYGGASAPYISTSTSKYGGSSLYLPGGSSSARIQCSNSADFAIGTGNFTVECWFYINSWGPGIGSTWFNVIFDTRTGTWPSPGLQVCFNSSKNLVAYTGSGAFLTSGSTFATATWYHMALVRSGTDVRLYVNGSLNASVTSSANFSTQGMMLGTTFDFAGGGDYRGYIDEFRFLNGSCLYNGNFTP